MYVLVILQWILSYSTIFGNKLVDSIAKAACNFSNFENEELEINLNYTILKKNFFCHSKPV